MIRYTLFVLSTLGAAAIGIASIAPANSLPIINPKNVTVVYKTEHYSISPVIVLHSCAVEDCSDTPDQPANS